MVFELLQFRQYVPKVVAYSVPGGGEWSRINTDTQMLGGRLLFYG